MGRHREFDEEKALDGAIEVFWRRGYSGAPIQEICDAMGLNPGSVYSAFGNKNGLFLAVIRRYLDSINRPGLDLLASSASGLDGIRAYFDYISEGIVSGNRRWGCLGTNAFVELKESDDDVAEIMSQHLIRLETTFRDALIRDMVGDPEAKAKYLLCVAQGLNVIAKTSLDRQTIQTVIDSAMICLTPPRLAAK
ncbi:TetR/AcrR family transcriptional regulator [Roseovarius nitratireducens]|uniref:TetR/AcrR family transcriptional regulator n=1 Tax=Roseovarius nitratireducens TaxID=2044597 RepID=UPI000CE28D51|nr:TetR/AcrR family transcriptional regulator [Roseovarius nitratireducens]